MFAQSERLKVVSVRCFRARDVAVELTERGFSAISISSQLEQQERLDIVKKLKSFKVRLLVSTDLVKKIFLFVCHFFSTFCVL